MERTDRSIASGMGSRWPGRTKGRPLALKHFCIWVDAEARGDHKPPNWGYPNLPDPTLNHEVRNGQDPKLTANGQQHSVHEVAALLRVQRRVVLPDEPARHGFAEGVRRAPTGASRRKGMRSRTAGAGPRAAGGAATAWAAARSAAAAGGADGRREGRSGCARQKGQKNDAGDETGIR